MEKWVELKYDNIESCYMISNTGKIKTKTKSKFIDVYHSTNGFDYVMHEAFCLDSEENIFHAYEKHHSTTRSVSEVMNKLNVKNLILYHTEDSHKNKKELYEQEGKKYFNNNVIVPIDLEEIILR